MSITPEAVKAASKAICAAQFPEVSAEYAWNVQFDDGKAEYRRDATAALTAAWPLLRDQMIDELALALDQKSLEPDAEYAMGYAGDYLRSQKGQTNDQ